MTEVVMKNLSQYLPKPATLLRRQVYHCQAQETPSQMEIQSVNNNMQTTGYTQDQEGQISCTRMMGRETYREGKEQLMI